MHPNNRIVSYAMQDADIVRVFYTIEQMKNFYENNRLDKLEPIYFWDEKRWNNRRFYEKFI
jgi:hypothetical protein